ncbi:MAG: serine protease [Candidatus Bipolaricaulota bacterium]
MNEEQPLPEAWEAPLPEVQPRPRRWWVPFLVLVVAGALLAMFIPGLLPQERAGSGTGFVIAEGGYILTAAHVVRGADEITVRWEGRRYRATTVATNTEHDLALLLMEDAPPMPVAVLGRDPPELGDEATAVGYPTGTARSTSLTTSVAGLGWWAVGPDGTVLRDLIATREPFRPGYSGAPLVNASGEVVGVVTGSLTATSGREFGFAVSIRKAAEWLRTRGVTLPVTSGKPDITLSGTEIAGIIGDSVVRVEVHFPPGTR